MMPELTVRTALVALALSLFVTRVRAAGEAQLRRHVEALGSDRYAEREAAMRELIAAGGSAVPLVAKAVAESDREKSTRAMLILRRVATAGDVTTRRTARHALADLAKTNDPKVAAIASAALKEALSAAVAKLSKTGANINWDESGQVRRVNFSNSRVDDSQVAALDDLEPLEVDLRYTHISDVTLARLAGQTQLEVLNLMSTRITDAGMKHLAGLTKLRSLSVERTAVTDEGLTHLKALSDLKVLYLGASKINGPGLKHIEHLPIEYLSFAYSPIGDDVIEHVVRIKSLTTLGIDDTKVTDACLPAVAKLDKLKVLWLDNTAVTDASVAHLKNMKSIETLHLENTKLTAAGYTEIRATLKKANVFGNAPEEGIKAASSDKVKAKPTKEIGIQDM